ncbi:hypothetical protein GCM10020220_045590 [Nonomuraea rubra]|uniref:hypothetical protein n=1 Tax=Nonomuraea rubra TaxID=46180 RepID=UPI0031EBEB5B
MTAPTTRAPTRPRRGHGGPAWFDTTACYQYARVGRKHAQRSGFPFVFVPDVYDGDYMKQDGGRDRPAVGAGREILYGNNHARGRCKKSTWPGRGDRPAVTVSPLHRVTSVAPAGGALHGHHLSNSTRAPAGRRHQDGHGDRVFFAAGRRRHQQALVTS